jgi:membrane-associated phospholipid phosphatase
MRRRGAYPVSTRTAATRVIGAHLAAGMLVFATMTLILVEISKEVISHEPMTVTDVQLSTPMRATRSAWTTVAMRVATSFGSTGTVTSIAVALALYLLWRRRLYWLAALALSVPGGALLNMSLKYAVHRPRPRFDNPILTFTGYSFPSGHTMMATVLYGVVCAYLCAHTVDWRRRVGAIVAAGALIALVASSRVYLGAHYLTDVLAAMAEGCAWLSLCLTAVFTVWQRRSRTRERQGGG